MEGKKQNNDSLVPYKSNSLDRVTNDIDITNRLINEQAEKYFKRGILKCRNKDYKGGMEDYTKAIELSPNNSNAYFYRGNAKCELKDCDGAIEDFDKSIELNPSNADAYTNRSNSKRRLKDLREAVDDALEALRLLLQNPK
jgi:tetratricopeptide (TPR) repeat protein